MTKSKKTKQW